MAHDAFEECECSHSEGGWVGGVGSLWWNGQEYHLCSPNACMGCSSSKPHYCTEQVVVFITCSMYYNMLYTSSI